MAAKRPSGWAQLKAAGKTGIVIGFDAEQLAAIDAACKLDDRTRPNFIAHYALAAARKIIENNSAKNLDTE